ncbi:unnamed protein product [Rhodiola kirilowii]
MNFYKRFGFERDKDDVDGVHGEAAIDNIRSGTLPRLLIPAFLSGLLTRLEATGAKLQQRSKSVAVLLEAPMLVAKQRRFLRRCYNASQTQRKGQESARKLFDEIRERSKR